MINTSLHCPQTLTEAITMAESLLTDADRETLQTKSLEEVGWMLHMTLGHMLRNGLGLWNDQASSLFDDINRHMVEHLAVDADTASAALIDALWHKHHPGAGVLSVLPKL